MHSKQIAQNGMHSKQIAQDGMHSKQLKMGCIPNSSKWDAFQTAQNGMHSKQMAQDGMHSKQIAQDGMHSKQIAQDGMHSKPLYSLLHNHKINYFFSFKSLPHLEPLKWEGGRRGVGGGVGGEEGLHSYK